MSRASYRDIGAPQFKGNHVGFGAIVDGLPRCHHIQARVGFLQGQYAAQHAHALDALRVLAARLTSDGEAAAGVGRVAAGAEACRTIDGNSLADDTPAGIVDLVGRVGRAEKRLARKV